MEYFVICDAEDSQFTYLYFAELKKYSTPRMATLFKTKKEAKTALEKLPIEDFDTYYFIRKIFIK